MTVRPADVPPALLAHPDYEVVRELGRGGMGVVYLARHRLTGRDEVLKVVGREWLARPGAEERFLQEIRMAARLQHPNVVAAYGAMRVGDMLVLAMEYVPGEDLAAVVGAKGALPVRTACHYARQVAAGLQHAFEKGMVHRDIKPANLMRVREVVAGGEKHVVKVLDFGLAKAAEEKADDAGLTGYGRMLGTPDYMAPEQILDAASTRTPGDIYSLGGTLYFLLTAEPPFAAKSLAELFDRHRYHEPVALNLKRPEVPAELAAVVAKMMAKDPARRYQTPAEVVAALLPFASVGKGPVSRTGLPKASPTGLPRAGETARPGGTSVVPSLAAPPPAAVPVPVAAWPMPEVLAPPALPPVPPPLPGFDRSGPPSRSAYQRPGAKRPGGPNRRVLGLVAALAVLVPALGLWAGGAFRVRTPAGTIVIENVPDGAEVSVDGTGVAITRDGKTVTVAAVAGGKHKLRVVSGGAEVYADEVTVAVGGKPITVRLEPRKAAGLKDDRFLSPPSSPASAAALAAPEKEAQDGGFVPLFNGKDLTGWKTHQLQPGGWAVEDGVLVGRSSEGDRHLYTEADNYQDVHIRAEVLVEDGASGGILARAPFGPTYPSSNPQWPDGYEATINASGAGIAKTGTIRLGWGVTSQLVPRAAASAGEWFTLELIVRGNEITTRVNRMEVATYTDEGRRYRSGHLALEVSNKAAAVRFRTIEVKRLGPAGNPPPTGLQAAMDTPRAAVEKADNASLDASDTPSVNDAEAKFAEQVKQVTDELRTRLEQKSDAARSAGNKGALDEVAAERAALDNDGVLSVSVLTVGHRAKLLAGRQALMAIYKVAISSAIKAKQDGRAAAIEAKARQAEDDPRFAFLGAAHLAQSNTRIRSHASNLSLDAEFPDRAKIGCRLQLYRNNPPGDVLTQHYRFVPTDNGFVRIVLQSTGLVVQADPMNVARDGCTLQLWEWKGGRHQQWAFVPVGKYYRVHNRASGKVLEADPNRVNVSGCRLRLGAYKHEPYQEWLVRSP